MEINESFTHRKLIKENNPTVEEIRKSLFFRLFRKLSTMLNRLVTHFFVLPPSFNVSPNTDLRGSYTYI